MFQEAVSSKMGYDKVSDHARAGGRVHRISRHLVPDAPAGLRRTDRRADQVHPDGMRFFEIDLIGVYVAPISVLMVAAWVVTIALRRVADRFGLMRHVWHPALFVFAVYMIVLSSIVLVIARGALDVRY